MHAITPTRKFNLFDQVQHTLATCNRLVSSVLYLSLLYLSSLSSRLLGNETRQEIRHQMSTKCQGKRIAAFEV